MVERNQTKLLKLLSDNSAAPPKSKAFALAAYRATRTLAFIAPSIYVPEFLSKIREDLDPMQLDFIGVEELGIWQTPPGTTFVDGESTAALPAFVRLRP